MRPAEARFNEVFNAVATDLAARGFRRKGLWFTKRPFADERFWCIGIRKIPQVASKRIVFQLVSRAGRTAVGDLAPIGTLERAMTHATFERHISEGPAEVLWAVWPSTDTQALAQRVIAAMAAQSLPALEAFGANAD